MSYYTIALEFWTAVGLALGTLPVVAVTAKSVAGTVTRSFFGGSDHAPIHSVRTGPLSCG